MFGLLPKLLSKSTLKAPMLKTPVAKTPCKTVDQQAKFEAAIDRLESKADSLQTKADAIRDNALNKADAVRDIYSHKAAVLESKGMSHLANKMLALGDKKALLIETAGERCALRLEHKADKLQQKADMLRDKLDHGETDNDDDLDSDPDDGDTAPDVAEIKFFYTSLNEDGEVSAFTESGFFKVVTIELPEGTTQDSLDLQALLAEFEADLAQWEIQPEEVYQVTLMFQNEDGTMTAEDFVLVEDTEGGLSLVSQAEATMTSISTEIPGEDAPSDEDADEDEDEDITA